MEETNKTYNHPQISSLYDLYLSETQPFRKVHRMIDLFETIIKMHTVVIMAEYFKYNKFSDSAKGLLSQGLRTPSLGTWQLFSRVLFEELQKENISWFLEQFKNAFILLDKSLNNSQTNIIAFRNSYAHGATPSDEKCIDDLKRFEPFLNQLLKLEWLENSATIVQNEIVLLKSESRALSLHPILLYRDEINEASIAFFNDLKNDKIGLLNYPLGKHYREKEFYQEFNKILPLNDWKKSGTNDFQQRVEELTETFKGRMVEREKLLNFVSNNNKGYLSIQGNPGIGKSALIAQFFKDLKAHESLKNIKVVEYFIRRGTQQAKIEYLLEYLVNKTDELFPKAKEIKAEGKMVFELQNQLFSKWRLWAEHNNGNTMLFLIDGLDEGVENNLVNYLPSENFQNILFIYGSRPGGHKSIDELWGSLPIENHIKLELGGLGKEDIRAMIYEVANKYELERESVWIDAVQVRSQGNPLYLKLLCDAIANNSIGINDIHALPKEIDDYYKAILQRYAQDTVDGDDLLLALYTFSAAKDYLTIAHIGLINQLGEAKLQRIGSTLKEVLFENPLTEKVLDYQLFHESFREYLCREKAFKINEAKEQIINFCATWKELYGSWEQCYTLEHYASHLSESKKASNHETLLKLIYNNEYINTQKQVLRHFNASNRLMQLALLKSGEVENHETMLEAALCLVDLKYEEANDAPRIVEMVANNEMELALLRIESFGGNDKEGLQQKFILYMLCLMELTLLESKHKPFRKEAIEKLMKHLDENLPVDHSVLNWNDFFPSYWVFLTSYELFELNLDYFIVYKRTDEWDDNWLKENEKYSSIEQLDFLLVITNTQNKISNSFPFKNIKKDNYEKIVLAFINQNHLKRAMELIEKQDLFDSISLLRISENLADNNYIDEAIYISNKITDRYTKDAALCNISSTLADNAEFERSISINESIEDTNLRDVNLNGIIRILIKYGRFEIVTKLIELIKNSDLKKDSVNQLEEAFTARDVSISNKLNLQEKDLVNVVLPISKNISTVELNESLNIEGDQIKKIQELIKSAYAHWQVKKIQLSYEICLEIIDNLSKINTVGHRQREESQLFWTFWHYLKIIIVDFPAEITVRIIRPYISGNWIFDKSKINDIIRSYTNLNRIEEVLEINKEFGWEEVNLKTLLPDYNYNDTIRVRNLIMLYLSYNYNVVKIKKRENISKELIQKYSELEPIKAMLVLKNTNFNVEDSLLIDLAPKLLLNNLIDEFTTVINQIKVQSTRINLCLKIYYDYSQIKLNFDLSQLIKLALDLTYNMKVCNEKVHSYLSLSKFFREINEEEKSKNMFAKATELAREIQDDYDLYDIDFDERGEALKAVCKYLIELNNIDDFLSFSEEIIDEYWRILTIKEFVLAEISKGNFRLELECLEIFFFDTDEFKSRALVDIIKLLIDNGNLKEGYSLFHKINDNRFRDLALAYFALEVIKNDGRIDDAIDIFYNNSNSTTNHKISCLLSIVDNLFSLSKVKQAQNLFFRVLEILNVLENKIEHISRLTSLFLKLGFIDEALISAEVINNELDKSIALSSISAELASQGRIEEALICAKDISDEGYKSNAMSSISAKLAIQGKTEEAEAIGIEIPQITYRYECWKSIAFNTYEYWGWKKALETANQWKNEEVRVYYLKGLAENIHVNDANIESIVEILPLLLNDTNSIESVLQAYGLNEIFFKQPSKDMIKRLNLSLNLQWALDITAKFEKEFERSSQNVLEWINEIEDENDREDVLSWAEKVEQGKMTEEKFLERINKL